MKKLLVGLLALAFAGTAIAEHHGTKHMVRLQGLEQDAATARSVDLSWSGNDADDEEKTNNLALNYAIKLGKKFQLGFSYQNYKKTTDGDINAVGDSWNAIGLAGYWNKNEDLANTCYFGLHLRKRTNDDNDTTDDSGNEVTTVGLEYGHRWHIADAWGLHLAFSPSVVWTSSTTVQNDDDGADDLVETALAWNWLQFDVLF